MKKRRAARDVFREQNVANFDSSLQREAVADDLNPPESAEMPDWLLDAAPDIDDEAYIGEFDNVDLPAFVRNRGGEQSTDDEVTAPPRTREYYKNIREAGPPPPPSPAPQMQRLRRQPASPTAVNKLIEKIRDIDGAPSPQSAPTNKASKKMIDDFVTSEELQLERGGVNVRETGFLWYKRVIVPPNAYVVHTRMGREKPVTIGLGVSFRYNPRTDAYLVVPAAMQTIGVVSNCISREKQGINVLAYVQWQISDFSIAYRKLDFSDASDPLGIVNAQLREQADAAVKDKIATMSIDEVLTDKAPIIEELTRRLIEVAEGRVQSGDNADSEGLGIKIVTVQLKEALVSSKRLWEHLQAPFRHEQERLARVSQLQMQQDIQQRERESYEFKEISDAETRVNIARIQEAKTTEQQEVRLEEEQKRNEREQTSAVAKAEAEAASQARMNELQIQQQIQQAEDQRRLAQERAQLEAERLLREAEMKQAQFEYERQIAQQQNALATEQLEAELSRDEIRQLK
ncbi:MAG: hypothetical protein AAFR22_02695, partial [Chloroflexota bacterium]